jgi:hypothetical protein
LCLFVSRRRSNRPDGYCIADVGISDKPRPKVFAKASIAVPSIFGLLNILEQKAGIEGSEHFDMVIDCAFGEAEVQKHHLEVLSWELYPPEIRDADSLSDQRGNLVRPVKSLMM